MHRITVKTQQKRQVIDITAQVNEIIQKSRLEEDGVCFVHVLHTTAALTTADLDPGTDLDMLDFFAAITPKLNYRHPHNPEHAPDHILSAMLGTGVSAPVERGALVLGGWQRIILVELDGPRERELAISFLA